MNDKYITVSQINKYIKYKFDQDINLKTVYLRGEISNFKNHASGHFYFTLKDENSRILAVMFRSSASKVNFKPMDGINVLIIGRISCYEANGAYQIYVEEMIQDGIGNLYLEFEKLKKKLGDLGYFDESLKKPIPRFPKKIGVITADTGAAIRDIITTINRRYNLAEVILFPCLVQGEFAKDDIIKNIKLADSYGLDTIILGRGGGSIEDLWAFNEEIVARAIHEAKTPIISAVGHEIDFTISDFVADLRAATPTAAAELAVPNTTELINSINHYKLRLGKSILNKLELNKNKLNALLNSYALKNPKGLYEIKMQKLDNLIDKLELNIKIVFDTKSTRYISLLDKMEVLNPIRTLKRGYTITKINNKPIKNLKEIKKDSIIETEFDTGKVTSRVIDIKLND
ncbi:MAG: exodeoxyribonuclease VII large subunit [bacterium]|nr:exodeoxyribonuclease VII large subunit [bacterium]